MSPALPSITVIVPVRNGAPFLRGAIDNVLAQTFPPAEILVIDDGSEDESAAIVRRFPRPVRLLAQPPAGPGAARNLGLKHATGDCVGFLDVDDRWPIGALEAQARLLAVHPEADIAQGLIQQVITKNGTTSSFLSIEPYYFVNLGSALFRRSVFEKVGLFDESLIHEDTDWYIRAWESQVVKLCSSEVSLYYHIHAGNMRERRTAGLPRFLKKHLERRRSAAGEPIPPGRPPLAAYLGAPPAAGKRTGRVNL